MVADAALELVDARFREISSLTEIIVNVYTYDDQRMTWMYSADFPRSRWRRRETQMVIRTTTIEYLGGASALELIV